jgi:dCMP deaminase
LKLAEAGGCQRTVHAEINAIVYAAKHGIATDGSEMHCTLSPCLNCAKAIINSGIKSVSYLEEYRNLDGVELLNSLGITCQHITLQSYQSHLFSVGP